MHKVFAVIRREYLERVRTKAFIIGTLLGPVFFAALAIVPGLLLSRGSAGQRVAVVDATDGRLGEQIVTALAETKVGTAPSAKARYDTQLLKAPGRAQEVLDSLVPHTGLSKQVPDALDGILVVDESAVATGKVNYYGANVGSMEDMQALRASLTPVVITVRLQRAGVDPAVALGATTPVALETQKISDGKLTGQSGGATFALAYAMGFILYLALLLYGTQVMTSIIEEKSNRIIEVLVSSLTPFQMMLGKVVGVGLVSLTQLGIWGTAGVLLTKYKGAILGAMGMASQSAGGFQLPALPIGLVLVFLLFFALGFLLYSSAYAAVGSMCSTVQDTQQAQMPIMMFVIVGFFSTFALLKDPTGTFARVAGFIPPLAPFVIPVRYSLAPIPISELAISVALTVLGMLAVVWLASRIYRVGILMYGKRASFRDVIRWVGAK
jgi:ABC-2 type transport system permease protein